MRHFGVGAWLGGMIHTKKTKQKNMKSCMVLCASCLIVIGLLGLKQS